MPIVLIILIVLLLGGGGLGYHGGHTGFAYGSGGLGFLLVIILIVILLSGRSLISGVYNAKFLSEVDDARQDNREEA